MEFKRLTDTVNTFFNDRMNEFEVSIQGLCNKDIIDRWYYRQYLTAGKYARILKLDPASPLDIVTRECMIRKYNKEQETQREKYLQRLYNVIHAKRPGHIDISVEWAKSRTWGYNPSVQVYAGMEFTSGHASGCGYDKESAAIASAFNDNYSVLRVLYEHAERGGVFPYGVSLYAGLPSFDGGIGTSCYERVFETCGYTMRTVAAGKMYRAYTVTENN